MLVLELATDNQRFEAVLESSPSPSTLQNNVGSLLRITGVCTSDRRYRSAEVPFILLLRSAADVQMVGGPPWWSARNLGIACIVLAFGLLLAILFYVRAERWRLNAVLEERQRLAHELHDTLAQSFAGIGLQLRALRRRMPSTLPSLQADLDLAAEMVRQGHQEARQSISLLRPTGDKPIRLIPALVSAAHRIIADDSICIQTRVEGEERNIPLRTLDVLFRAGQEGIANVVRHASARRIMIRVAYTQQSISLEIQDDGIGVTSYAGSSDGYGLKGIAQRVERVRGSVQLHPASPSGSCLTVEIPLAPQNAVGRVCRSLTQSFLSTMRRVGAARVLHD